MSDLSIIHGSLVAWLKDKVASLEADSPAAADVKELAHILKLLKDSTPVEGDGSNVQATEKDFDAWMKKRGQG